MIDRRVMSNMDAESRLIHTQLEEWGRWVRSSEKHAWPAMTLLARIIEQGPYGAAQADREPLNMPAHLEAVECAVLRLPARERDVVTAYYTLWEPPEVVARKVHMGRRQMNHALRSARSRIAGFLDAIKSLDSAHSLSIVRRSAHLTKV